MWEFRIIWCCDVEIAAPWDNASVEGDAVKLWFWVGDA